MKDQEIWSYDGRRESKVSQLGDDTYAFTPGWGLKKSNRYQYLSISISFFLSFFLYIYIYIAFYIYIFFFLYIYIYIYISLCRAASMDIPDPLSPLLPIVHRLWQVFRATSCILTELLYVCSSWPSCFCSAIRGGSIGVHHLWARPCFSSNVPACLVRLTWIVFVMGGRWPYSWCLVGCCRQDLFNIARNILVWLPSSFFSSRFVSVQYIYIYVYVYVYITKSW